MVLLGETEPERNCTCQPDTAIEASLNDPTGRKKCENLRYALGARGLKLGKITLEFLFKRSWTLKYFCEIKKILLYQ